MPILIDIFPARTDNYGYLVHDTATGKTAAIDAPDAKAMAGQAATVNQMAHQVGKWFPAGSGPESGQKTRAKAEIWSDSAGFATAVHNLEVESAKLETVAKGGDIEALKAQAKATGGACGGCHTKYRAPEQH